MTTATPYIRSLLIALALGLVLLAGGCALKEPLAVAERDRNAPTDESAAVDPDLQPVAVEPEICLDQELAALERTGSWDEPLQMSKMRTPLAPEDEEEPLYDFPVTVNKQVEMYLQLFQTKQHTYFKRWLARSGRYLPMILNELEAAGLPQDLAYLAMIESGFSQRAYSRSRAVGLWQFMPGTGRDYGLQIDKYVDERRDAEKSTKAAVAYLRDLYREFDDWYLAVAAYNGGPGTIRRAVKGTKSRDFWKIAQKRYLQLETKRYVPKLIAAIIIAKEPDKYGFTDIAYEAPLRFDTFEVGPGLSLKAAALLTESDPKVITMLNQELKVGKTPLDRERYVLKIPAGTKTLAESNLPRLHSVVNTDYKVHIVKNGETLAAICRRYNINTTTLLKVNNLKSNKLASNSRLRIPFRTIEYRILPEGMDPAVAARSDLILHTIKKGETISKISKQYQVPAELIVAWNGLSSIHKITAGQQLALYLSTSGPASVSSEDTTADAGSDRPSEGTVAVLRSTKKQAADQAPQDRPATWYLVKNGDSLWTISRRFNSSPADIKRLNGLKSNLIHPGSRLKISSDV